MKFRFTPKYKIHQNNSHYYWDWEPELLYCCDGIARGDGYEFKMFFLPKMPHKQTKAFEVFFNEKHELAVQCFWKGITADEVNMIAQTTAAWVAQMVQHGYLQVEECDYCRESFKKEKSYDPNH